MIYFEKDLFSLKPRDYLILTLLLVGPYFGSKFFFDFNPIRVYLLVGSLFILAQGLFGLFANKNLVILNSSNLFYIRVKGKLAKVWALLLILAGLLVIYGYFRS